MNIFVLDRSPIKAAQMLCDAHVVKMIVESCQLLSTHDRLTNQFADPSGLYKPTHQNHPCRVCLHNVYNKLWLMWHLNGLLAEYTCRYGKYHKCHALFYRYWRNSDLWKSILWLRTAEDYSHEVGRVYHLTDFPRCMPDEFKVDTALEGSVVQSYRNYYKYKQQTMQRFRYTKRDMPEWLMGA